MFWGLIMEPNKRYTQVVEKAFHISQAALDASAGDSEPCQVMVVVDNKNFLICTLQKGKTIQMNLDLYFKRGESVAFLTNGKSNVHLSGYLDPELEDDFEEDEESDEEEEEEEVSAASATGNKRKIEVNAQNKANGAKKAKKEKKAKVVEDSDEDSESDNDDKLQKLLDGEDIDSDENDDSFQINTSAEPDSDEESEDDEEDEAEEEEEADDDDDDEQEEEQEEKDSSMDTSKGNVVDTSNLSKSQKRRLKKRLQKQANESSESPKLNGVDKAKKQDGQQKGKKEKIEGKKEAQEEKGGDKKEKKSLTGGVYIEDLKVGTGPVAKAGKTVMVYYEGRLKQNNKMFDNCVKGPGFKFRLGSKEVISGWDVGLVGMKVGGKRKITCPPNMAYGAKGTPPVIPPNSTLVFEVELKNVK